jgi:UDP-glucose 4-epimerase
MMKVLVTGGAGFIGSTLVNLLLQKNHTVRVLDNLSTGYDINVNKKDVEFMLGDIRDKQAVQTAVAGVDTIFHLAASIGNVKSLADPQEDALVNAGGTALLLDEARKANVGRFVYSSSAAIFGELVTMPIAEDHPQNPDSPYGVSKLAAEKYALCFAKLYGMTAVCLRYFNVYGVRQRYDAYGNVIPIFAHRLYTEKPLTIYGDGEQTRDFINVQDVAMANYLAATVAKESTVFNVGSGSVITINELAKMVQVYSGISTHVDYAPPRPSEVRHCRADISKLKAQLGFEPTVDMNSGLKAYFEWFAQDLKVKAT